jgi:hypothetical protein
LTPRPQHGRNLTLALALAAGLGATAAQAEPGFQKRLELQGFAFDVSATAQSSISTVTVTPHGRSQQKTPVTAEIDGTVTGAEIDDLDANGFPEVYIYVTSAGSGSYGSLAAWAVNNGKSMTPIFLPPVADSPTLSKGYMGHDEFAVVEGTLVQRFPLYREGDANARPTGKIRQLQYKLKAGEAGWVLRLDRSIDF